MRFVSFFAGIGGIDLGLERASHECVGQVEIDPYCLKVLAKHWPGVPKWKAIEDVCRMLNCGPLVFPAPTYRTQASAPVYLGSVRGPSGSWCVPFAWFDQSTFSWRTWQRSFIEGWERFLGPWPKAGMTRNGIAYQRLRWERPMSEIGSSWWQTPTTRDWKGESGKGNRIRRGTASRLHVANLCDQCVDLGRRDLVRSTEFRRRLMGFPKGWCRLPEDAWRQLTAGPLSPKLQNTSESC